MKTTKRGLALAMACMMLVLFAGIGGVAAEENEPATIRWLYYISGNVVPDDAYQMQQIKNDLNITYQHVPPGANLTDTLNQMMLANDYPDVVTCDPALISALIDAEVVLPIEEYLTEEYVPNLINIANNWETALEIVTRSDGHIYSIPFPHIDSGLYGTVHQLRHDWLDNLGLAVPTNLDELAEVLIAFANDDPDQDGNDNTFGMALANDGGSWITGMNLLFACDAGSYYLDENGDVISGMFSERMIDSLKYLNYLSVNGALPIDTISYNHDRVQEMIMNGQIGYDFGYQNYDQFNDAIRMTAPNGEWGVIDPIQGVHSIGFLPQNDLIREQHAILITCENPEAVFRLMDYMSVDTSTDVNNPTYEGTYWMTRYGEKGVFWDVTEDGQFDQGQYFETSESSAAIKAVIDANPWQRWGTMARIRSKYDDVFNMSATETVIAQRDKVYAMPTIFDLPQGELTTPLRSEGVELPPEVGTFIEIMLTYLQTVVADAMREGADIEKLYADFLSQAELQGWPEMKQQLTDAFRAAGRI